MLKADALWCLAVFISLILLFFPQMWGAFNFRIKVDFLRVVPDPKARLAGASQAGLDCLLEATPAPVWTATILHAALGLVHAPHQLALEAVIILNAACRPIAC